MMLKNLVVIGPDYNKGAVKIIDIITSTAMSLQQYSLEAEVGARLGKMAKESIEAEGAALIELLDSAKQMELAVNPHLGSTVDLRA